MAGTLRAMPQTDGSHASATEARIDAKGPADPAQLPLRARKQRRAREHAMKVAGRLFREHGYDATSLEDIANEAEMSVSSLLRYFGGKERLALAHHIDHLESFRRHMTEEDKPVLERWRAFIVDQASSLRSFNSYHEERQR